MSARTLKFLEPGQSKAGWHEKLALMQCPRKYAFKRNGVEPSRASSPKDFFIRGDLGHTWLSHYYIGRTLQAAEYMEPDEAVLELISRQPEAQQADWQEQLDKVTDACIGYESFWESADRRYEILMVESELEAEIEVDGRKMPYTQRVDLAVRDVHTNKVYIWDHKFLSRSAKAGDKYAMDGQFVGYQHLGQARWGAQFGGVIANIVRWGTKSNPTGFEREMVIPAPHAYHSFWYTVRHAERIRHTIETCYDVTRPETVPGLYSAFTCVGCRHNYNCRWGASE